MKCPKCHSENTADTLYCSKCGTKFEPSEEISTSITKTLETPLKDLTTGTIFAGKYNIIEELGRGGMGVVYKVEDTKLKRSVALKFLSPELTQDVEARERFLLEAQAASALEHTNICTIHEIDETEDRQMYIAMAYYEGETLKEKLKSGPLKLEVTLDVIRQIAQGLAKAHGKGIVHRDIKPANIIVTNDSVVKIVDFGLAKLAGVTKVTKTGTTMGTAAYMSPEQARGESVDHQTDIWSLGIVLYEMLSGQLPFKGEHEQSVIYSILNEDPAPISSFQIGIPAELEQIVAKALKKNLKERYQHIDKLLADLQKVYKILDVKPMWKISAWSRLRIASPLLWTSIIVVVGIALGLLLFYPARAIPFQERDWILITDFDNLTGDDVFDKSLNTALSVSIGQSSYINVLSKQRINEALRRMQKEDVEDIDDLVGREIAVREGIKVIFVPSISRVGNIYMLTGVIEDPFTGESLRSEIVRAQGKDKVLNALDELTRKIRRDLGESLAAISKRNKPLAKVTTSSLEALKQYSLGIENHWNSNFKEARLYYESALQIDPNFTAAKASLGSILFEKFDREKGKELLSKAIHDIDNLTEREKYGILAFHAYAVENDLEKAVQYIKMRLALYPDDEASHNNLGWYNFRLERYKDAIAAYKKAIEINPYLMLPYNGLNWIYLYHLGELDLALELCERQISYNTQNASAYNNLGWAYLGKDNLEEAKKAFEKALEINPRFILVLYRLAHTYRLQGRFQEALQPLEKILEIDQTESSAHYDIGTIYQLLGNTKEARRYFEKYRKDPEKWVKENPKDADNYISLGVVLTRLGEKDRGWSMGQKAMAIDPTQHFGFAMLLSAQGKKYEAIDQLELAIKNGYHNYIWIKIHADFQPLYDEPRFQGLLRRGLKQ